MSSRIPLSGLDLSCEDKQAVQKLIQSSGLTIDKITDQFEDDFADYLNSRYTIAVTNETAAIHLSCLALGLGAGDEVIMPSLASIAVANAIRYTEATPVFADIESYDNLTISLESVKSRISPNTRAILVFHYAGFPCDMPAILEFAKVNGLFVIEDAEYAVGAELSGRKLGTWADIGCFCFNLSNNMDIPGGGMLSTNNAELAKKLRSLRSHELNTLACNQHKGKIRNYDLAGLGHDSQLDKIGAAIGLVKLSNIVRNNRRRRQLLRLYQEVLFGLVPQVHIPFNLHPGIPAVNYVPVLLPEYSRRDAIMEIMMNLGIQMSIRHPPIHTFSLYRDETVRQLSLTEDVASRELDLPVSSTMKVRNVLEVVEALRVAIN